MLRRDQQQATKSLTSATASQGKKCPKGLKTYRIDKARNDGDVDSKLGSLCEGGEVKGAHKGHGALKNRRAKAKAA
jgi:hypothetical protein